MPRARTAFGRHESKTRAGQWVGPFRQTGLPEVEQEMMADSADAAQVYQRLADAYEDQGQGQLRDRYLVLAAAAVYARGQASEAEQLRLQLLRYNPHHLLKPYASLAEALSVVDVQAYVAALQRSHPLEQARQMLSTFDPATRSKVADQREVFAHEAHDRKEELSIYRLRDTETENSDSRRHVMASSTSRHDDPGWSSGTSVAVKAPQPSANVPSEPDIYRILREDLPQSLSRMDPGERESASGPWAVFGLFLAVSFLGLMLAGTVLVRPLWNLFWHP